MGINVFWKEVSLLIEDTITRPSITSKYNKVSDLLNVSTGKPLQKNDPEIDQLSVREFDDWERLMRSVNSYLHRINTGWNSIQETPSGPTHLGWPTGTEWEKIQILL